MIGPSLILAVLSTLPDAVVVATPDDTPVEVVSSGGVLLSGYENAGWVKLDPWLSAGAEGRGRLGRIGDSTGLLLDVSAFGLLPLERRGPAAGMAGALRVGLERGPWSVTAGALGYMNPPAEPVAQLFPSLLVTWRTGDFGVSLGLLDRAVGPVARLTVEHRYFGIGYAGLVGLEGWVRLPLSRALEVEVRGFGSRYFQALQTGAVVGVVWRPDGLSFGGVR